jgi:tetratricopeptide (TPR) repeat protein
MTKFIGSIVVLYFIFSSAFGQSSDLFSEGLRLEKDFKVEAALDKYELFIKTHPNHALALTHASRMLSNIGGRLPLDKKEEKKKYYVRAKAYAVRGIALDNKSTETHLAYIISIGLMTEVAGSPREKIQDAKVIRDEAETLLKLDSTFAPAYFILGKWHFELARLNWFEQMACKLFFGGLPEGISMDAAVRSFRKASILQPNTILFLYGEASAYHYQEDDEKATRLLQQALALPLKEPDDIPRKERCSQLLAEIQR